MRFLILVLLALSTKPAVAHYFPTNLAMSAGGPIELGYNESGGDERENGNYLVVKSRLFSNGQRIFSDRTLFDQTGLVYPLGLEIADNKIFILGMFAPEGTDKFRQFVLALDLKGEKIASFGKTSDGLVMLPRRRLTVGESPALVGSFSPSVIGSGADGLFVAVRGVATSLAVVSLDFATGSLRREFGDNGIARTILPRRHFRPDGVYQLPDGTVEVAGSHIARGRNQRDLFREDKIRTVTFSRDGQFTGTSTSLHNFSAREGYFMGFDRDRVRETYGARRDEAGLTTYVGSDRTTEVRPVDTLFEQLTAVANLKVRYVPFDSNRVFYEQRRLSIAGRDLRRHPIVASIPFRPRPMKAFGEAKPQCAQLVSMQLIAPWFQ